MGRDSRQATGFRLAASKSAISSISATNIPKPMGAKVTGPDGKEHAVSMGSYGIGPSRLIAAIIEASHDENGIIWPKSVAPFDIGLINMKTGDAECDRICGELYAALTACGQGRAL